MIQFDWVISLGQLLTMLLTVSAVSVAFLAINSFYKRRLSDLEDEVLEIRASIMEIKKAVEHLECPKKA